jgi:hypothetical protein
VRPRKVGLATDSPGRCLGLGGASESAELAGAEVDDKHDAILLVWWALGVERDPGHSNLVSEAEHHWVHVVSGGEEDTWGCGTIGGGDDEGIARGFVVEYRDQVSA